jgi:PAS domain S-box-containing protein
MASATEALSIRGEPLEPVLSMRLLAQMSRVRIILVFVLLHGLLAASAGTVSWRPAAYGGISMAAVLAIASYFVFNWRREFSHGRLNLAAACFVIGDVLALSFFIYGMGGVYSYFFPLLLCEVVFAALYFHRLEIAFVTGIVCCALLLGAVGTHWTTATLTQAGIAVTGVLVVAWLAHGMGTVMQRDRAVNQRIIRHLGQPVCLLGSDGRILLINPQLEQLAGTRSARVVGKRLTDLAADEDAGLMAMLLRDIEQGLLAGEAGHEQDLEIENPESVVLRRSVFPCLSSSGVAVGWVVMWHDVTALVESVRVHELSVSLLSHEMRSPIACLRLLIEVLGNITESDHKQRESIIAHLMEETDRLSRLVASVLELAQFDSPGYELTRQRLTLVPMIRRVGSMFDVRAVDAGVRFDCRCPQHLPVLYGNEDRLEQVLINLCENAINHTPEGGEVVLEARPFPDKLVVEVHDTGLGIPDDLKERIFEKFCSGGTELTGPGRFRMAGGLGLGLALSKRIVELHDGQIEVASTSGSGTTFKVSLPLMPVPRRALAPTLVSVS